MMIARIAPVALAALLSLPAAGLAQQSAWPAQTPAPATGQFPATANQPTTAWPSQGSANNSHPAWSGQGAPAAAAPGWSAAPAPRAQQQQPPCADEFIPLRDDAQKKGSAIQRAAQSKDRKQICQAFRTFVAAEAKVVKYVTDHGARCGIPADAVKVMKANHTKSTDMRNQICNAAAAPSGPPPPSLSDALGTSRLPSSSSGDASRGGTFNTLTGNPLTR